MLLERHEPSDLCGVCEGVRSVSRDLVAAGAPRFTLPTFEGPLDLLLQLIRENEVDIYDIPIAEITRQYLERLARWHDLDLTRAGDYLVMAATLLEIKSRMLLPKPDAGADDEPDPRAELVQRLVEYQRFADAVGSLRDWEEFRSRLHFRSALENPDDYRLPAEPGSLRGVDLARILESILDAAGVESEAVSAVVPRQRVSLRLKMAEIMRAARAEPQGISFAGLIRDASELFDIVIAFLAVLELLRTGRVRVIQRRPLSDFRIAVRDEGEQEQDT